MVLSDFDDFQYHVCMMVFIGVLPSENMSPFVISDAHVAHIAGSRGGALHEELRAAQ